MLQWYAIYTRSRFEKRTHGLLIQRGIEAYIPLVKAWRLWSDRKKQVEVPLLSSYLFVRVDAGNHDEMLHVLNTPGVVRFISFEGRPVPIPEHQLDALKRISKEGIDMVALDETPPPGAPVMIESGPLKGLYGEVANVGKGKKLVIRIDVLDKCITVNVPMNVVKVCKVDSL